MGDVAGLIWFRTENWRTVLNTVMHLRFPQNAKNFSTIFGTITFSSNICSMELVS